VYLKKIKNETHYYDVQGAAAIVQTFFLDTVMNQT